MSLYGSLMIGVSALDAFSNAMSTTSSNIANVNTIGYKDAQTNFSTLLANSMGEGDFGAAGVITSASQDISQQGLIQSAGQSTDMAISGNGFFVVSPSANQSGGSFYTRAGDFNPDANGDLQNSAGYYLMGYPIGSNGTVAAGSSLGAINVSDLTGKAEATTTMTIQANLQASTTQYAGTYNAGDMTNATPPTTPDFSRTINIYDSQGGSRPITINYLKTGTNTWSYEVSYGGKASDLDTAVGSGTVATSPLLASGTMSFDSNGNLSAITPTGASSALPDGTLPLQIPWDSNNSGLGTQDLAINLGTLGSSNGMSQFDSASTLTNSNVDGALFGTLSGVSIDNSGIVTAQFSNGLTQKIAQVPIATFTNANGLVATSGNAYAETEASGGAVISNAGTGGAGTIQSSALEGSTVDLATEFTNLITTQRAYEASTRVITTASEMLSTLNQMGH